MGGASSRGRSATPWFLTVPPDVRPEWVVRERLSAALDHGLATHSTVLLEAPSGYGKTVALSTWAASRADPTGWLTATAHDEDPAQLLSGVLTALIRVHPRNGPLAALSSEHHDGELPTSRAVLSLIETLLETGPDTVLVIDDMHFISDAAFSEVILPIIRFSRGRIRLVCAATRNLQLWFSRSLVFGDTSQIPPTTLAFGPEEVALAQRHASGASTVETLGQGAVEPIPTADLLWSETQGWPVAVVLALQGGAARPLEPTDTPEEVTHYVETAVLSGLRCELQDFVLSATTCSRVTGELVAHLTGRDDAAALLEECRNSGLFLDRFHQESSEPVYRWHSTFARHCRQIQSRRNPDRFREQHRLAAEWMSTRYPAEAVFHARQAGDIERAVTILEDNWLQMICGGQSSLLASMCARIPAPWHDTPTLAFIRACCLDVSGEHTGSELLAERARVALQEMTGENLARARRTQAFADLFLLQDQLGLQTAAEHAYRTLTDRTLTTNQYLHGLFLVGWTEMRLRHNPVRAIKLLSAAASGARDAGHEVLAGRASANLAFAFAFGGRFADAQATLDALSGADGVGEWDYYDGGIEVMAAIYLAYWRGNFDTVLALARGLNARGGHPSSYAALGRVHFAFAAAALREPSLYAEAENMLLGVSTVVQHGVPWPVYRIIGTVRLAAARSDYAAALDALQQITKWTAIPATLVMAAELYRRLGQPDRAVEMLRGISRPQMVSYIYVSVQFTTAALAWERQDRVAAHRALERSLKVAAAEGIIVPFTGLDDSSRELLVQHSAWGTAYEGFVAARLATAQTGNSRRDMISAPLSAREREIFSYLGTTMTAEEIAAELHVSVNTVRSHQRSIYRKLGVSTRREAIRVHL